MSNTAPVGRGDALRPTGFERAAHAANDNRPSKRRNAMGNIIYLDKVTSTPASEAFAQCVALLAIQSEQLQTAINDIGEHLRNLADAVNRVSDPAAKNQLRVQISHLRCQLLLASLELAKLTRLQRDLKQALLQRPEPQVTSHPAPAAHAARPS
jgi:hypothetical protein